MKKTSTTFIFAALTSLVGVLLLTSSASAQVTSAQQGFSTFAGLVNNFNSTVVKALGTLFMSGAVVAFLWGIVQYIWGVREGKPEKISAGNQFMIWGLVALFVMFSVYGIIRFMQKVTGTDSNNTITIPGINLGGSSGTTGTTGNTNNNPLPVPSGTTTNTNGTPCDYTDFGTRDGVWSNGSCVPR